MSLSISGTTTYVLQNGVARVEVGSVTNTGSSSSNTVRIELWATITPYSGGPISGIRIADYIPSTNWGRLSAGESFINIRFSDEFTLPNGEYFLTLVAAEYTGAEDNNGFSISGTFNFAESATVGPVIEPDPVPVIADDGRIIGTESDDLGLQGTTGRDTILGMGGDDFIDALSGNDKVYGGLGEDFLQGGAGNDYLSGGADDDYLSAGSGRDTLRGGTGDDVLSVNGGASLLKGEGGNDGLYGGTGGDRLYGGSQNDTLKGAGGNDRLYGGSGGDRLYGGTGRERLYGGSQNDTLTGDSGRDRLYGSSGRDQLYGGTGNDSLNGGAGSDRLLGGTGVDLLYGGTGRDRFIFLSAKEAPTKGASDRIADFSRGDIIDLSAIDANTQRAGNQAFKFIKAAGFSGTAGELRFSKGMLSGDIDGDGRAEFEVAMSKVSSLHVRDFDL